WSFRGMHATATAIITTAPYASRLTLVECASCSQPPGLRAAARPVSFPGRIASCRSRPTRHSQPHISSWFAAASLPRRALLHNFPSRYCRRLRKGTQQAASGRSLSKFDPMRDRQPALKRTPPSPSRYRRIVQGVWSAGLARVVSSLLTLVSLPLAVRYLGAERYGVWATVATTAAWINLLDLGIANTLTNHISRAYALGDRQMAARFFTNALMLTAGLAALAGLSCAALLPHINWVRLLNVSAPASAAEVTHTVEAAVALMLLALPCNLIGKVLAGYQELHRSNY